MDHLSHNISVNLKRIRHGKGMSLDALAEQTGVSKSMLAQIEKGTANPSIGVLGKITNGLRIELNALIEQPPQDYCMIRTSSTMPTKGRAGQYRVWTCFPYQDDHRVEVYKVELEPHGQYDAGKHGEKTREYLTIMEGSLELVILDGKYNLTKDDVFRFEADQDHIYRNPTDEPCSFICFFETYEK